MQGDSGGSLVCKNSFGQDELVGILSGAAGCGNFTMFFANVYLLLRFIEDQIHSFTNRTDITQTYSSWEQNEFCSFHNLPYADSDECIVCVITVINSIK